MKIATALNHRDRIIRSLADLYSSARIFGMPSRQLTARSIAIRDTLPAKAPRWILENAEGWEICERGHIERELIFCFDVDGRLYSTHRDRDDYYEKHGMGPKEVHDKATTSGHYWDCNGELRPYFVSPVD